MEEKCLEERMTCKDHLEHGFDLMWDSELCSFIAFPLQLAASVGCGFLGYKCFETPGAVVGAIGGFASFPYITLLAISYVQEWIKQR